MITATEAKELYESYVEIDEVYEFMKNIESEIRSSCLIGTKSCDIRVENTDYSEKTFKEVKRRLKQLGFSYNQSHYQISDSKNYNFTITW